VIYLDHNATTPILPEVLEAMMPYLTTEWGNPSSAYKFGSKLKAVVETAREQVAELIGAHPREVIFTSCATESNNAAIAATLKANPTKRHIVTSQVEHSSVLNFCMALERQEASLLIQERWRASAGVVTAGPRSGEFTSPNDGRSGGFTPPFPGGDSTSSNGGVNPPLHSPSYRVTYLPVDREGLLFCSCLTDH